MELYQLYHFKVVAECNNFTLAAEKLGISQPALSVSIKKLEGEFGMRLFDRIKQRIFLNDAGRIALAHANEILESVENMSASMKTLSLPGTVIKLGFVDSMVMWYFSSRTHEIHEYQVHADMYDWIQDDAELLLNHVFDLVVSREATVHREICSDYLFDDYTYVLIPPSHPMYDCELSSLRQANFEHIALWRVNSFRYAKQVSFFSSLPNTKMSYYDDLPMLLQKAMHENTPTLAARTSIAYHAEAENRRKIRLTDPELETKYYISYLKKNKAKLKPVITLLHKYSESDELLL